MQLTRRHRATALSLALIAGGVFLIFVTRVFLLGFPEKARSCETHPLFGILPLSELQRKYHWTMERIVEERMRLYEGQTLLQCEGKKMSDVIPRGETAAQIAISLPYFQNTSSILYSDFESLLTEFWRMYDCHLFAIQNSPNLLPRVVSEEVPPPDGVHFGGLTLGVNSLDEERQRARAALDRLLFVLRSSEQYLPLHASLRCLQRGSVDVRNAAALLSDASQCLPGKLSEPETSLLK